MNEYFLIKVKEILDTDKASRCRNVRYTLTEKCFGPLLASLTYLLLTKCVGVCKFLINQSINQSALL